MNNRSRLIARNARFDIAHQNISTSSMEKTYASGSVIQIDFSDDEKAVVEKSETEPIDNTTTVGNFASVDEIESVMIAAQNTSGAHNSNNG